MGLDFKNDLTKEQYEAVTHGKGAAMVASTVGSGKTRCITYRIAYLLESGEVDPHEILAITFTNKAASEMKERVAKMVPRSIAKRVWISTFHAMCARMLRSNHREFGIPSRNYSIADADDSKSYIVEATMAVTGLPKKTIMADRDQYGPGVIQTQISGYKNVLVRAKDLDPDQESVVYRKEVIKIYRKYEQLLRRATSLDFDDLLLYVALGLKKNKSLRVGYSEVFEHVLVDEYQDTNVAQYEIMRLLTSIRKNPYVVGDDDQCLPGSEEVITPEGPKQIRFIKEGDKVLSGGGYGIQRVGEVEKVFKRSYNGEVIRITTKSGKTFRATPEHGVFGRHTSEYGSTSYSKNLQDAEGVARKVGGPVNQKARLTGAHKKYYDLMPIGNSLVGMRVPTTVDGEVVGDTVVGVEREFYKGYVYDLSIPKFRNYSVGGVLVHNSIYAFRGADPKTITKFQTDYPTHKLYKLEKNFRSFKPIADVANAVIVNNEERIKKTIVTVRTGGDKVKCLNFGEPYQEAAYIVEDILNKVRMGESSYKDFTILYRINSRSRPFEEFFRRNNIPYRIVGALGFYQRKVIKDIVAYLRLVHNIDDYASFNRVYNEPARGIGDRSASQLMDKAYDMECSPLYMVKRGWYKGQVSGRALDGVRSLKKMFKKLRSMPSKPVAPLVQTIIEESGYRRSLELAAIKKKPSSKEAERVYGKIELLEELESAAAKFDEVDGKNLEKYLEFISLMQSADDDRDSNQVTLMSVHASKGLEFPHVYLVSCCQNILPHERCFEEENGLEEERRIFFVATTRAEDSLTISHFDFIPKRGDYSPSQFLEEAGETLEHIDLTRTGAGRGRISALTSTSRRRPGSFDGYL